MSDARKIRILIVDDEPDIVELLEYNLLKAGYDVDKAYNGHEAVEAARRLQPELILLDVMMPEMDGIQACREIRQEDELRHTLVFFLTARIEEYSEIAGFSAGADDYITKPIKPVALLSRIEAALRRRERQGSNQPEQLNVKDLKIDRSAFEVEYQGKTLHFARKEFELLYLMASHPGKVFNRNDILDHIWGNDVYVGDRTIDVHIRKIREKIEPNYIKTVKGVGYKFEA